MAEFGRILMYEVHDEGGLFNQHTKNADCAAFGCVPVTAHADDARDAASFRFLVAHWLDTPRRVIHTERATWGLIGASYHIFASFVEALDAVMDQEAKEHVETYWHRASAPFVALCDPSGGQRHTTTGHTVTCPACLAIIQERQS